MKFETRYLVSYNEGICDERLGPWLRKMKKYTQFNLLAVAVWVFSGCGTPGSVSSNKVTNDLNGNFHLYVSNQSYAVNPVDIKVFIDGELVAEGDFDVGSQHNWHEFVLKLSPGRHSLVAKSSKGQSELEQMFEISDKRWSALAYWFYPKPTGGAESCPRHFSFDVSVGPIHFM